MRYINLRFTYLLTPVVTPLFRTLPSLANITAFLKTMYTWHAADYAVHCRLWWCGPGNMDWEIGRGIVRHYGHIVLRFASRKYRTI